MPQYRLQEYIEGSKSYFAEWFDSLDAFTAARVDRYVRRMERGNLGDSKGVGEGVHELCIDFRPDYRIYYGVDHNMIIILLGGGSKRHQSRDIAKAIKVGNHIRTGRKVGNDIWH